MHEPADLGDVESAVAETIESLNEISPLHDGLAATARVLARTLDDGAGLATAAVARELRATLEALTKEGGSGGSSDIDELIARLSTPLGHPEI